jgi:hypothetical protein
VLLCVVKLEGTRLMCSPGKQFLAGWGRAIYRAMQDSEIALRNARSSCARVVS